MRAMLFAACLLAPAMPAAAQTLKDGALITNEIEAVVTVVKVDREKRTVTMRGPKGGVATLKVPPQAQNLDRVKPGDRYKLKYVEAVAIGIRKGGDPAKVDSEELQLAPKGGTPGGMAVRTMHRAVVIDAIDYTSRYVAVRDSTGQTLALKAADDVPLEQLSAGDRVSITYTEALAIQMVAQPAATKPAAKKKS